MSIKYVILGLLSRKPATGYELKKVIEGSPVMLCSSNNSQIYKTLGQLLSEGLVTVEASQQEASHYKKVYTITGDGLTGLKDWVLSEPEAPEFRKTFLLQLAWADRLSSEELNRLLSKYENELSIQILVHQEKNRRNTHSPGGSPREALLWNMLSNNLISSLRSELDWVRRIRRELYEKEKVEQEAK